MSSIGTATIKVNTDILEAQAQEVNRLVSDMKSKFSNMESVIRRTEYYWIGEAGNLHRKLYNEQKDEIDVMLRRLLEHSTDLRTIAGTYKAGEAANVAKAQVLATDIIS
ncbi:MAG: hypothetical protein E7289_06415 [Lachnospiraceae bacterium]|nr:hypothetical protein [Lachnospiraceae bacterium]